jgi:hypothetical protein
MESNAVKANPNRVRTLSEYLKGSELAFAKGNTATPEQKQLLSWAEKIDAAARRSPEEVGKIYTELTKSTTNLEADTKKMLMGYATQLQLQMSDPTRKQNFQPMVGKITGSGFELPKDVHIPEMSTLVKKLDSSKIIESLDGLTTALNNPSNKRKVEQSVLPNPPLVR